MIQVDEHMFRLVEATNWLPRMMEGPKILNAMNRWTNPFFGKENSMDSILKLECFLWNVPIIPNIWFRMFTPLHPIPRYLDSGFQKGRNWFFGGEKTHAKTIRIRNYWLKYDGNPYESNTRWWFQICSMFAAIWENDPTWQSLGWFNHQLGIQGMWFWDLFIFSVAQNLQATFLPVDVGIFSQGIPTQTTFIHWHPGRLGRHPKL